MDFEGNTSAHKGVYAWVRTVVRSAATYIWHALTCAFVFVLALFVFWAASYSQSVHRCRQAEKLLQQLETVQFGAAGFQTAQKIARDFKAKEHCSSGSCEYGFAYSFDFGGGGPLGFLRRTEWDYAALRPWSFRAYVSTKDGQVTSLGFSSFVGRGREWLWNQGPFAESMWGWLDYAVDGHPGRYAQRLAGEQQSARTQGANTGHQIEAGRDGLIITTPSLDVPGGGQALDVYLSPDAPREGRRIAFDLNLGCATSLNACTKLCQLAPSAWRSHVDYIQSNGWAMGYDCPEKGGWRS